MEQILSQNWTTGEKLLNGNAIQDKEFYSLVKSGNYEKIFDESESGGICLWKVRPKASDMENFEENINQAIE